MANGLGLGLDRRDGRNLFIVAAIMAVIMAALTSEPLVVRVVVGLVTGAVAGVSFIVVTVVMNRFKPDHW